MNAKHPDPEDPEDPRHTPGLEPGGEVPPGETPPGEDSTGGAGPDERHNPAKGWAKAPVIILAVLVLFFVVYFVAWAVEL
ncbi:DUF6480 family protein [Streptomyces albidus (ex Kaewkla and Franco 2022)]|uniref:DUF6480 family protein n=1 Tax=Streptomyces albidus (ex Kaewkla and Franco 2022) TaxID=722709 RepID=UPI0015EEA66B|nr:DUF6480 family protein [Streptomyces albidus (ex Kaewkla and Franco 2022)]